MKYAITALALLLAPALAQAEAVRVSVQLSDEVPTGRDCIQRILETYPRISAGDIHRAPGQRALVICLPAPGHWEAEGHPFVELNRYQDAGCLADPQYVDDAFCE